MLDKLWPLKISPEDINKVLEKVFRDKNLDFRHYKQAFLNRRLTRRLQFNQVDNINNYLQILDEDEREYQLLIKDLVIQVSEFFRDPPVFDLLSNKIIPQIIEAVKKKNGKTIRIWCPGCANGEEAYSLAILFMENLAKYEEKSDLLIYATDICENALQIARKTYYAPTQVKNITPDILQKYFIAVPDGYKLLPVVKNHVKFGQHDLVLDPPINHLNLLACRNVCIYLERELQQEIYKKFVFALELGSYLVLGKSESLTEETRGYFNTIEPRLKIYQKIADLPKKFKA